MEHTYLLRPGRWRAEGTYYDETGRSFPLAGETELVQDPHDVGFFLFCLSHYVLPLSSLSTAVQADMRRPFFIDTPAL